MSFWDETAHWDVWAVEVWLEPGYRLARLHHALFSEALERGDPHALAWASRLWD